MKLRFSVHYHAEWGQQLVACLSYRSGDSRSRTLQVTMNTQDGDYWTAETSVIESRRMPVGFFSYYYMVADGDGKELRREWSHVPRLYRFDASKSYTLCDQWRDRPLPHHLYSSAYAVTMHLPATDAVCPPQLPLFRRTILFRVAAPQLLEGQSVALLGSHPSMGAWSPARYLPMEYAGGREWMLALNVDVLNEPLEYKYVVVDSNTHQLMSWEEGNNRTITELPGDGDVLVAYGEQLRLPEKPWRAAGVAVPVFALRSSHSYGVGDFGDLYRFVDWAAKAGLKVVQLLPVNDTTSTHQWGDSDPYNIVSAFALHPHYLDLEQLPPLKSSQRMKDFHRRQRELSEHDHSDYEAVDRVKTEYAHELFEEQGTVLTDSDAYRQWREENKAWLEAYAEGNEETCYVQYELHRQLMRTASHARSMGIALKGDLPIGIKDGSVESRQHQEFFHTDRCTGTPPDAFNPKGHNWGFPTYNWEATGLKAWFQARIHHMEQYFDALRIDHVLGFFRMWEIPAEQLFATMGHFVPALPYTPGEIEHAGLPFRCDFLTHPFINDHIVEKLFGIHAQYVRENYLEKKLYGLYDLKGEVATQKLVEAHFSNCNDENSQWIRDGLYRLVSNVLFIEDQEQPGSYHPRVEAYREPVFEVLTGDERDAYLSLYTNYFTHRHALLWAQTGYERLSMLTSHTHMLICAEDLGMQPDCVKPVLDSLRILTLEMQRLPKQHGQDFAHLEGNPVRSVTTISNHDMEPMRLWWQNHPEQAQLFFSTMMQKQGRAPRDLPTTMAEEIIARHLYSPSMLCILSLQDWLAMDNELRSKKPAEERINLPGDAYNRWQWRMHVTIEQLMQAEKFNAKIKTMTTRSNR